MRRYLLLLGLVAALAGIGIFFAARRGQEVANDPTPASVLAEATTSSGEPEGATTLAPPPPGSTGPTRNPSEAPAEKRRYARIVIKAGDPIPELFPFEAEREAINNLALGDDPARFAIIASNLNHTDARVRETARLALIRTGDRAAVPHLEQAAKSSPFPEDAKLMVEAAQFLSLPRFLDVMAEHAKAASPSPTKAP